MVTRWIEKLLPPSNRKGAPDELRAEELRMLLGTEYPPVLLDIRSPDAYARERLPGAINTPLERLESALAALDRAAPTVVY